MSKLDKVFIFGGTHGNEWTGIMAVTKYSETLRQKFQNLDLHFIHANPEAYKINKRFKDEDLNRAFQFLHEERPDSYEHMRAQELKSMIHEGPCFVLDLHTTTSNMGNTVIISHAQPFNFQVAAELVKNLPDTRVILSPDPNKKFLASQSEFGMMIEVGPVAHGVIDANILEKTLALITELLKAVSTPTGMTTGEIEIYEEIQDVYYPQNENGELTAIINKDFQGKDFVPVEGSFTPFKAFAGEEQEIRSSEKLYPIFINEAAYYPMKLAFTLCRKRALNY